MADRTLSVDVGGRTVVATVRRSSRARRVRIRVEDGAVEVVLPRWAPSSEAVRALAQHGAWALRHVARQREDAVGAGPGRVLFEGRVVPLVVEPGHVRSVSFSPQGTVVRGPDPAGTLEAWMRAWARQAVERTVAARAPGLGVLPRSIQIRDQKSKWGACTSRGTLTFNWRLVMAPPEVLDYVVVHELAHLLEMNHSHRFWALVERHCPDHRTHRTWLRKNAGLLRAPVTFEESLSSG